MLRFLRRCSVGFRERLTAAGAEINLGWLEVQMDIKIKRQKKLF